LWGMGVAMEGQEDLSSATTYYQDLIDSKPGTSQAKSATARLSRLKAAEKAQNVNRYFPFDPEFGEAGFGWWNLKRMPLHVYIDSGEDVQGYRMDMRNLVYHALDAWNYASLGSLRFVIDSADFRNELSWNEINERTPILQRLQAKISDMPADPVH